MSPEIQAGDVVWEPSADMLRDSGLARYERWLGERHGLAFEDYQALHTWSVEHLEDFWQSVWDFEQLAGDRGDGPVLARDEMPGAQWFPGARLNYAENLLRRGDPDGPAMVLVREGAEPEELTRAQVRRLAAILR